VDVLGRLALAIVQAGAYIRETSCSLHDYLDTYERQKTALLRYLPDHLGTHYQHSVYTTWQASVDLIESRQKTTTHYALRLLSLLGFYHLQRLPVSSASQSPAPLSLQRLSVSSASQSRAPPSLQRLPVSSSPGLVQAFGKSLPDP
jgi:hypothetical protein